LQRRGGRTLPLEFLELQAWCTADGPQISLAVLIGPTSARLSHWRADSLNQNKIGVEFPSYFESNTGQSRNNGLLSTTQALWGYVAGVKAFTELIRSHLSPAETLWLQLPPKHCLHCGERVLRALLLLWHERYVAHAWEVTFPT